MPNPGIRDFYVLSRISPDAGIHHMLPEKLEAFSWLEIDHSDEHQVVTYRLHSIDEKGKWIIAGGMLSLLSQ